MNYNRHEPIRQKLRQNFCPPPARRFPAWARSVWRWL